MAVLLPDRDARRGRVAARGRSRPDNAREDDLTQVRIEALADGTVRLHITA
ncbi:hypothetical protein [Streptomyces sp. ISL-100]|uniref:hypothetical protein n=1 Tax=Streptomyces sp. ISL-100 TaxID=2819173 RepID=UPI001BE60CCC|nr:hypothetical protein [Streptomyces sp. ISL-100]MBT2395335.1 hypothetical protein [Streptomyces sp. ISL-100]